MRTEAKATATTTNSQQQYQQNECARNAWKGVRGKRYNSESRIIIRISFMEIQRYYRISAEFFRFSFYSLRFSCGSKCFWCSFFSPKNDNNRKKKQSNCWATTTHNNGKRQRRQSCNSLDSSIFYAFYYECNGSVVLPPMVCGCGCQKKAHCCSSSSTPQHNIKMPL